jgi:large subunit ribosomal protein L1
MEIKQAIAELKKSEKKKFEQTVELIVNLKGVDPKKENVSAIVVLPNQFKEKKVCGFLNAKSNLVPTITKLDFPKYKEKKELKNLVKNYDFFIASATLMPSVATNFGKILGPAGKMPSPQLGVLMQENDNSIKDLLNKISKAVKIRMKEASIKIAIAKENMSDDKIIENILAVYRGLVEVLPTKKENVRSVMVKLTMSKPIKVEGLQ